MKIITDPNQINKKKWCDFVINHPNGNVFQTPFMFEVYQKTKNYEPIIIITVGKQTEIIGLLVGYTVKEHSGLLGNISARTIVIGGPLLLNNDTKVGLKILQQLNAFVGRKSIFTQFRNLFEISFLRNEFQKSGYVYEDHLDIINDIAISKEEIKSNLKRSAKKNYNKAVNKGLKIKLLSEVDEIKASYELIKETYKRVKLPYPEYQFFENLYSILFNKGFIKFFGAFFEGTLISVRVELTYKTIIYDYFTGTSENAKNKYPNDFIPVEIFIWGHDNKYKSFDFGGAGKPNVPYGVRDYKLKFGGELVEFGRFEKIHKPILFSVGKLGLKVWKKLR